MNSTKKPAKIAFVGTSCVGKTSLFESLRKKYQKNSKIYFVEEAARVYYLTHPQVRNRFAFITQSQIQKQAQQLETEAQRSLTRIIICDRSVLDAAAYVYTRGGKSGAQKLMTRMKDWISTYTEIYLLDPKDIPYFSDEIRQESVEERVKFHEGFIKLFFEHNIPFQLLSGTLDQRLEFMEKQISQFIT